MNVFVYINSTEGGTIIRLSLEKGIIFLLPDYLRHLLDLFKAWRAKQWFYKVTLTPTYINSSFCLKGKVEYK